MSTETVPVFCMCVKRGESTDSLPFGDWHSDHSDYRTAAQASSKGAFKAHELNWTELELRNKQPHVNSRIRIRISQAQSVLVSLQPIKSWCRRAWPMNVSCIWVALLSVSSVKFISCYVNTSIGMLGSELQFANSSSVQFMCCEQAVILMTWDVGNIETSGYSYGSDSSLRCDVTPLLRSIGCVRRTQKLDASIAQCVSGTCHPKTPLPVGVSGSPPYLTPNLSALQMASRSVHPFLHGHKQHICSH